MKCKIFTGTWTEAMDLFNKWAKGKTLSSQVIIHTIPMPPSESEESGYIAIVVYHPSTPRWDTSG